MASRFDPPGGLTRDLNDDAHLLDAWSGVIAGLVRTTISSLERTKDVQFVNPFDGKPRSLQPRLIPWITMPARLANHKTRDEALKDADARARENDRRDHQPEYSEWFTRRDGKDRVTGVDVTTELPEYWDFLAEKNRAKLVELYQTWVSPDVREGDLFTDDIYNKVNKWNSSQGAMHMTCGINTLTAAMGVIGGAIIWRRRPGTTEVMDVQYCDGSATENADPALITHVNRLAREGRDITLENPPGIYILGLDLDGWKRPNGRPVTTDDVLAATRGTPPVRMTIRGRGFELWESTINGEPIRWGSQIAERVTVGPIAAVGPRQRRHPKGDDCGLIHEHCTEARGDVAATRAAAGRRP